MSKVLDSKGLEYVITKLLNKESSIIEIPNDGFHESSLKKGVKYKYKIPIPEDLSGIYNISFSGSFLEFTCEYDGALPDKGYLMPLVNIETPIPVCIKASTIERPVEFYRVSGFTFFDDTTGIRYNFPDMTFDIFNGAFWMSSACTTDKFYLAVNHHEDGNITADLFIMDREYKVSNIYYKKQYPGDQRIIITKMHYNNIEADCNFLWYANTGVRLYRDQYYNLVVASRPIDYPGTSIVFQIIGNTGIPCFKIDGVWTSPSGDTLELELLSEHITPSMPEDTLSSIMDIYAPNTYLNIHTYNHKCPRLVVNISELDRNTQPCIINIRNSDNIFLDTTNISVGNNDEASLEVSIENSNNLFAILEDFQCNTYIKDCIRTLLYGSTTGGTTYYKQLYEKDVMLEDYSGSGVKLVTTNADGEVNVLTSGQLISLI
jgi:hypothetical protein